jgi:hypothetical protein
MKTEIEFLGCRISIASRRRRRMLVTLLYAASAMFIVPVWFPPTKPGWAWAWPFVLLWACGFVIRSFGGRNTAGGILPPVDRGDERELHRRDHAYFLAYWWWDLTLLPAILAIGFRASGMPSISNPELRAFFYQLPVALVLASGILYYSLPQAILLWTEPDMDDNPEADQLHVEHSTT